MPRTQDLHKNVAAFLDTIAYSEGTIGFGGSVNDDGYNVLVGRTFFKSYADHPKILVDLPKLGIKSSAAGRYQLLARYFKPYAKLLLLNDFSPESQDKIALQIIKERGALKAIIDGDFDFAVERCANIWASFPGAGYGQHEHKLDILRQKFLDFGGKIKC